MWSNFAILSWNVWLEEGWCLYHTHPPSKFPHIGIPEEWEIPVLSAVLITLLSGRGAKEQMYVVGHCHITFWFNLFLVFCDFRERIGRCWRGGGWAFVCFRISYYLSTNSFYLAIMVFFFFQKEVEIVFHKKILSEEFFSSYVRMGLSSLVNSSILKKKNSILHYSFWFFTVLVLSKTFPLLVC